MFVLLRPDLIVISPDASGPARARRGRRRAVRRTPFGRRILDAYGDGVGLLFAADLERMTAVADARAIAAARPPAARDRLRRAAPPDRRAQGAVRREPHRGRARLRRPAAGHRLLARRARRRWGRSTSSRRTRRRAAAFVCQEPALVLDDILAFVGPRDEGALQARARGAGVQAGPAPARGPGRRRWAASSRSRSTARCSRRRPGSLVGGLRPGAAAGLAAERWSPSAAERGGARGPSRACSPEAEQVGGETFHSVSGGGLPVEIHYAFAGGYLVAAPTRAARDAGARDARRGRHARPARRRSCSAVPARPATRTSRACVYQNLGRRGRPLLQVAGVGAAQRRAARARWRRSSRDAQPTLVCVYGEPDGIQVAGDRRLLRPRPDRTWRCRCSLERVTSWNGPAPHSVGTGSG